MISMQLNKSLQRLVITLTIGLSLLIFGSITRLFSVTKTPFIIHTQDVLTESNDLVVNTAHTNSNRDPEQKISKEGRQYIPEHQIFQERQAQVNKICRRQGITPPTSIANSRLTGRMLIEDKNGILYCPVQKVGSSFWRKTLSAMKSQGQITSPYNISLGERTHRIYSFAKFINEKPQFVIDWFRQNAVSLLVVRDPYTKLFSGYADKLYHPNFLYWQLAGKQIQQYRSQNKTVDSNIQCGNDVSFSEFIKYVIRTSLNGNIPLNGHFTPIYKHCPPCVTRYDYISKFESFKEDFHLIMQDWNERFNLSVQIKDFERETALDIAKKHINICYITIEQFGKPCNISMYNFLLRAWRFLQISGVLPKHIELPFTELDKEVTKTEFLEIIEAILNREIDWTKVKEQRREALMQAYRTVESSDLMMLRNIVKPDCEYFGYDDQPPELFYGQSLTSFNYFDGL